MFKKQQRLQSGPFNRFFKRGRRFNGRYVTVVFSASEEYKIAIVVGKKVYKKAVDRNRLRRQLYATARAWYEETNPAGVYQCLVKPVANEAAVTDIRTELVALLAEASGQS